MGGHHYQRTLIGVLAGGPLPSSHCGAPFISTRPSVDATDFSLFDSSRE